MLIGLYLAVLWVIEGGVGFRPLLMLSILMIILGIQFFSIGLLGELVIGLISRLERRVNDNQKRIKHDALASTAVGQNFNCTFNSLFLIKHLLGLLTALQGEVVIFKPFWLLASLTLLLLYFVLLGIPWIFLYRVERGKQGSFLSEWTFFSVHNSGGIYPEESGSLCGCCPFRAGSG